MAPTEHAYLPGPNESATAAASDWQPHAGAGASLRQRLFEGSGWTIFRLLVDVLVLVVGNVAALVGAEAAETGDDGKYVIWLFPVLVCLLLAVRGHYRDTVQTRLSDGIGPVIAVTSLAAILLIAGAALLEPTAEPAPLLARAWLFGTIYLSAARVLLSWAQRQARATRLIARPTLIVGAGLIGAHVERRLLRQPELGLLPVGYLDADPPPDEMVPDRTAPVLGGPSDLGEVAGATGARHVVLGFSTAPDRLLIPLVRECEIRGLEVSLVPRLFESINVRVALEHLGGLPLFGLHSIDPKGWQFTIKHVLDAVLAGLLCVVFAPVFVALAVAVRLSSPGPVLFRQRRIGRDGRDFEMFKFRSMRLTDDEDENSHRQEENLRWQEESLHQHAENLHWEGLTAPQELAPGGIEGRDRRTLVGALMRRTGFDELPQLINVVRGDMSLVGPRPERPEFVDLYGSGIERYSDRHRVKSGITGWAQVHGLRGKTSLRDRVEWDNYYIENWSLSLDFKILLMTLAAVFHRAE